MKTDKLRIICKKNNMLPGFSKYQTETFFKVKCQHCIPLNYKGCCEKCKGFSLKIHETANGHIFYCKVWVKV